MAQVYLCVSYELFKAPKPTQGDKIYQREPPKSEPHFSVDNIGYIFVPDEKSRCKVSPELIGRNAMIEIKIKNKKTQQKIKLSQRFADKVNHLLNVVDDSVTYYIFVKSYATEGFGSKDSDLCFSIVSSYGVVNFYYSNIELCINKMKEQKNFTPDEIMYVSHVLLDYSETCISNKQFQEGLKFVVHHYGSPKK